MPMNSYTEAYREILQCGLVEEAALLKHLEQQALLDRILPEAFSFFYLIEIATQKYHFMGKRQAQVSGFSNAEFMAKGLQLFFQQVHPEEAAIIVNEVYRDFRSTVMATPEDQRGNLLIQYNYRFKRKDGDYINLMEQVSVVGFDGDGNSALLLGNVIMLNSDDQLPLQCSVKLLAEDGLSRTVFYRNYSRNDKIMSRLTPRELVILQNLASGGNSKEVADRLCISRHTVDTHRRNLLKKLNCKSVVDLARFAFQHALI